MKSQICNYIRNVPDKFALHKFFKPKSKHSVRMEYTICLSIKLKKKSSQGCIEKKRRITDRHATHIRKNMFVYCTAHSITINIQPT